MTGLSTLVVLGLSVACEARSSLEGAQTAVAVAQTAVPAIQTALPGAQATAEAGATLVSVVLSSRETVVTGVQVLLAGSTVDLKTTPDGVAKEAVTQVAVIATDTRGTFAQLDRQARQYAAAAARTLVSRYYPNASVSLMVVDSTGASLI
jgi:hypothetical protein